MAATPQNIKDFFALDPSLPPVTNQHLLRVSDMLAGAGYGPAPDSTDFVNWLYQQARAEVNAATTAAVKALVEPDPTDLLE